MKKEQRRQTKLAIMLLLRRTLREGLLSFAAGIKSLATPKGILATVPLIVSLVAFLKTSYSTTNLVVFINGPIVMTATSSDDGANMSRDPANDHDEPNSAQIRDFEMFMASDGPETIYVADIFLNITIYRPGGTFNNNCVFETNKSLDIAYVLNAEPLIKNYPYELRSAFVVAGNTILPLSSHLRHADMGKVGPKTTDDFRVREIFADKEPPIAFCISATAFTAGNSRHRVIWQGNSTNKDFDASFSSRVDAGSSGAGGQPTPEKRTQRLSLRGRHFERGINLFTSRRWTLF